MKKKRKFPTDPAPPDQKSLVLGFENERSEKVNDRVHFLSAVTQSDLGGRVNKITTANHKSDLSYCAGITGRLNCTY